MPTGCSSREFRSERIRGLMRIGIVGCGRIGERRARIASAAGDSVVLVADIDEQRAQTLARELNCSWTSDWLAVAGSPIVDAVVVSTTNNALAQVSGAALSNGKHVLCEKPLGRKAEEARGIVDAANAAHRVLKTGFNHRHHPAVREARALITQGELGTLLWIRAAYGHGGRIGYEHEWRTDPAQAGGGELLDQGIHLLDLARWFLGEFVEVSGELTTSSWPIAVEDNAFALLRTADDRVASIHASWTQWKNLFRFEVFGRDGYVAIEGLGGNYGTESLVFGRRNQASPPTEQRWSYPGPDPSWELEWQEFRSAILEGREPVGSGADGYAAALLADAIYESARTRRLIRLGTQK
jgi:predicted dehydrogenase